MLDIYKLSEQIEIDDRFLKLVSEVRHHRIGLGPQIAPAAPLDVDILSLAEALCDQDFYKDDYEETTVKLISDSLSYDVVKNRYRMLAERIFG